MKNKIIAKVLIKHAKFVRKTPKGWKEWSIRIDHKRKSFPSAMDKFSRLMGHLSVCVPPDMEWEPIVGDQVELKSWMPGKWMPLNKPFTGAANKGDYIRDVSEKVVFDVDDLNEEFYHIPDFGQIAFFEIKPVVCYYNEITGEQHCETIVEDYIKLDQHPDQIIWSIYERRHRGEYRVIGDWPKAHEAQRVYDSLNRILKVQKKFR